jgi:hypothetical protein
VTHDHDASCPHGDGGRHGEPVDQLVRDLPLRANVAKMHASHALTDDDRWPWLRSIAAWIGAREQAGTTR